jgi:hypothetical protein
MVEIEMTLRDQRVTMHACSRCDTRWWDSDGELVPLSSVLQLAAPVARAS